MAGNEEQIEYWNGSVGQTWTEGQERLDRLLAPLSDLTLDKADPQPGEKALDIGCGCGATTCALAQRGAIATGVDISAPMLERARQRAQDLDGADFIEADASDYAFGSGYSLAFSRFGVMFFSDPVGAFANIRKALIPGGRLVFVCWQPPQKNAWIYVAGKAIQPYLPQSDAAPDPHAPGPFAFAEPDYVRGVLGDAGFRNTSVDAITADLHLADTLDEAVQFQGQVGPVARALADLEGDERAAALDAARAALADHIKPDGLRLGSAAWLVSAAA